MDAEFNKALGDDLAEFALDLQTNKFTGTSREALAELQAICDTVDKALELLETIDKLGQLMGVK